MRELSAVLAAAPGLSTTSDGVWRAEDVVSSAFSPAVHAGCLAIEEDSFWFAHRNRCIVALVKRFPPDGAIVDVGGGNGYVTRGLREAGFSSLLLEPGVGGVHNAVRRGLAPVIHASLDSADFRPGSLSAIGLFDVIEHIDDDDAFLIRVHALLRDAGKLYLSVPAYEWLWSHEDDEAGHRRRYTRSSLRALLRRSGFQVSFISYFFVLLPLPIFFLRTMRGRVSQRARPAAVDHEVASPLRRRMVDALLSVEHASIHAGVSLPFGASLLAAAQKS